MIFNFIILLLFNFIFSSHPWIMIVSILLMIILIAFLWMFFLKTSWFSLMFLMMFLSGLMIIFLYMASLTPNYKFNMNFFLLPLIFFIPSFQISNILISSSNFTLKNMNFLLNSFLSLNLIFIFFWLLFSTLIIIDMITIIFFPLQTKIYVFTKKMF